MQVRPKKDSEEETPEWRKRLVHGGIPAGEHRDLFAPMGLESVFKPPSPHSEAVPHETIPMAKQSDEPRGAEQDPNPQRADQSKPTAESEDGGHDESPDRLDTKRGPYGTRSTASSLDFQRRLLGMKKREKKTRSCEDLSQYGTYPRTASGLEDLRNEGITPIVFSRSDTINGHRTSDIIQSALKQVTNKLGNLSLGPGDRPDSRASDSILMCQESDLHGDVFAEDDLLDVTSHSLPQDLSMGTQESGGRRAFSNFRREQYLGHSSFHKDHLTPSSFPSQRLSPSALANPRVRSSPPFYQKARPIDPPMLPRSSSAKFRTSGEEGTEAGTAEAMPSSGSPLKLFGDHDTFTNNKLLRRMSQFEETFGDLSGEDEPLSPSEEARRKGESRFLNVRQDSPHQQSLRRNERPRSRNGVSPSNLFVSPPLNRFGDGQLDNFDFSDTSPYEPKLVYDELQDNARGPSQFGSSAGRPYQRRSSRRDYSINSRSIHSNPRRNAWSRALRHASSDTAPRPHGPAQEEILGHVRAERSLDTPAKYPTPKRRRTILRAGSADKENQAIGENSDMSLLQKSLMQHGLDYDDYMAYRRPPSSQRPRTPTPLQTRSSAAKGSSPSRNRPKSSSNNRDGLGSPSERRAVPMLKVTGANEERRKGSITTQDFLSEATKIMDIIRSNGKTAEGLPSLEEFDTEGENYDDAYEEESTQEEFLRPPSREGGDIRKLREPKEPDPQVLSHLRKYQENEDLEFGVNSSAMSLRLDKEQDAEATEVQFSDQETGFLEASPKGIRIRENPMDQRKRKYSTPFANEEDSKNLSTRSFPTGSSQSSHAKGVLSSGLVAHLIPEQVNGLTYDRSRHQWVKERARQALGTPRTDDSEEDPFRDIPDLSVDELQEMMGTQPNSPEKAKDQARGDEGDCDTSLTSPRAPSVRPEPRPQTKDGEQSTVNTSSVQSKLTRYTSSVPNSGTRATSWSTNGSKHRESSSEVEHEIQLHEGRFSRPPKSNDANHQARVVTISFSSPLISHIGYSDGITPAKFEAQSKDTFENREADDPAYRPRPSKSSMLPSRLTSLDRQPFIRRPISRIDEGNEETAEDLSLVRRNNARPIESTPIRNQTESSLVRSADRNKSYTSFHLSPLPDFTVDQIDPPLQLEVSYIAQRTQPSSLRQVHGTFALATEELVKHITEAEPFEPYWEHVRRLILREKGLITLHKLNEFCPRLEDLDVSDNNIGHVSGIPSSLRTLKIERNCLSSLTAWGHLTNLQYLDVSGNELESLDGFSSLVHLRELKANDNSIRSINGIADLDGLLSLKLSNNSLTTVDFEGTDL